MKVNFFAPSPAKKNLYFGATDPEVLILARSDVSPKLDHFTHPDWQVSERLIYDLAILRDRLRLPSVPNRFTEDPLGLDMRIPNFPGYRLRAYAFQNDHPVLYFLTPDHSKNVKYYYPEMGVRVEFANPTRILASKKYREFPFTKTDVDIFLAWIKQPANYDRADQNLATTHTSWFKA